MLAGMWTHRTHRLVARPIADVRREITDLVDNAWGRVATVTTTEHHGRRSDWISTAGDPDDLDVVLTWTLIDLDVATFVTLELDEVERGPEPAEGLETLLDLLATTPVG